MPTFKTSTRYAIELPDNTLDVKGLAIVLDNIIEQLNRIENLPQKK